MEGAQDWSHPTLWVDVTGLKIPSTWPSQPARPNIGFTTYLAMTSGRQFARPWPQFPHLCSGYGYHSIIPIGEVKVTACVQG